MSFFFTVINRNNNNNYKIFKKIVSYMLLKKLFL